MPIPTVSRSEYLINSVVTANQQTDAAIAALADGRFAMGWTSNDPPPDIDVRFSLRSANGDAVSSSFDDETLQANGTVTEEKVAVAGLSDNRIAYVWQETSAAGETDIYAQVRNTSGSILVPRFAVTTVAGVGTDDQSGANVIGLADGNFMVAWRDAAPATANMSFKVLDIAGGTIGSGVANGSAAVSNALNQPQMAQLANGNVVLIWAADAGGGIRQQKFSIHSATGALVRGETDVNPEDSVSENGNPGSVVALANGGFLILFERNSEANAIQGRFFDPNGNVLSGRFDISAGAATSAASGVALDDGRIMVVYQTGGADISGRMLFTDGTVDGNQFLISDGIGAQSRPTLAKLADGRVAVSWETFEGVNPDIFAEIYDPREIGMFKSATLFSDDWIGSGFADTVLLGGGNDAMAGGGGNDFLYGEAGIDTLNGDAGFDRLFGGDAGDTLNGGDDADFIYGGAGTDIINGDEGDDIFLSGDADNDIIFGSAGNDRIDGGIGNDTLDGDDGDDFITGGDGNDTLSGGSHNDQMFGGTGGDLMTGGDGNDALSGELGNDAILAGAGNDILNGGDGDDILSGGFNVDNIRGGNGDDLINGDDGDDSGAGILAGDAGNDTILGGTGKDRLEGGTGNDDLQGGDGNDTLIGGADIDNLFGGPGNDTLRGDDGDDILNGDDNSDDLRGGNGNDVLTGGTGNDIFLGGDAGDDLIFGVTGNDRIDGGAGNDRLSGELDNDTLTGAAGNDIFVFADDTTNGFDIIGDWTAGQDRLEIDASNFGGGLSAGQLLSKQLVLGTAPVANDDFGQFLFETDLGRLSWDADGTGAGAPVLLADLFLPTFGARVSTLAVGDFVIVA